MKLCKMMPLLRMKRQLKNNLREQAGSNTKVNVGLHQQILKQQKGQPSYKGAIDESNALKNRTTKSSLKLCDRTSHATNAQAISATLFKDIGGEMSRMLCSLLWQ